MFDGTSVVGIDRISKWYGSFQAVKDLSFHVQPGEIFALLGPNGAGKSTTIRMILDIIRPDSGSISVFGGKISESARNRIGYLPEERGLYKSVRVLEMMMYLGQLKGLSRHDAHEQSLAILERFELADHAHSKVEELSKGMQQKVQFGVTVLHRPDLVIVDEPFSGLDPVNRLVIKDLLDSIRQRGGAIIMSTHQMNQIEEMADRMLMISKGQQKLYGRVDDIRREYATHAIMVEGEGQWETLPGVEKVEPVQNHRETRLLHLAQTTTSDEVLAQIARSPDFRIQRFEQAVPSLDEIFIRVAGEQTNA